MQQKNLALIAGALLLGAAGVLLVPGLLRGVEAPIVTSDTADEVEVAAGLEHPAEALATDAAGGRTEVEPGRPAPHAGEDRFAMRLRGRVVNRFHAPVAGARVFPDFGPGGPGPTRQVSQPMVTGADGAFAFQGRRSRNLRVLLQVAHRDHAPGRFDRNLGGATAEVDLGTLVLADGGEVLGRITDLDGFAIAAAEVRIQPENGNPLRWMRNRDEVLATLLTDRNGRFRFAHVAAGDWRVTATARGHLEGRSPTFTVDRELPVELADLRLGPGYELVGFVRDNQARPVANAGVSLRRDQGSRAFFTRTDRDGRFAVAHLPGAALVLSVEADHHLRFEQRGLDPSVQTTSLQITLQDGLRIDGQVTGLTTGQPVTRFAVRATRIGGMPAQVGFGGGRGMWDSGMEPGRPQHHAGGRFQLTGLQEGVYRVQVQSPDHQRWQSDELELRATAPTAAVTAVLERGLSVCGLVTDQTGRPLASARVELRTAERGRQIAGARCDTGGRFEIAHVPAGRYRVMAMAGRHAASTSEAFDLGSDVDGVVLALDELGALEGKVFGLPAEGADEARVLAIPTAGSGPEGMGRGNQLIAEVDADGSYRCDGLAPGSYVVRAFLGSPAELSGQLAPLAIGGSPADVTVQAGAVAHLDLPLRLPQTVTVSGTVTNNGLPAMGYRVALTRLDGHEPRNAGPGRRWAGRSNPAATTDRAGRYRMERVPAGLYRATVSGEGGRADALLTQQVAVVAGQPNVSDLALVTSLIRGRIASPDERDASALQGSVLFLPDVTEYPADFGAWRRGHPFASVRIQDGGFTSEPLAPGQYLVVLETRGRESATRSVLLTGGEELQLDLVAGKRRSTPTNHREADDRRGHNPIQGGNRLDCLGGSQAAEDAFPPASPTKTRRASTTPTGPTSDRVTRTSG